MSPRKISAFLVMILLLFLYGGCAQKEPALSEPPVSLSETPTVVLPTPTVLPQPEGTTPPNIPDTPAPTPPPQEERIPPSEPPYVPAEEQKNPPGTNREEPSWNLFAPPCPKQPLGAGFQVGAVETDGNDEPFIRVTRHTLSWSNAEPQNDFFDHAYLETIAKRIDKELCQGRTVMLVVLDTPAWATGRGGAGTGVPKNLGIAVDDPENYWARFMKKMSALFQDRIDHWILWNEPDMRRTDPFHFWDGTADDYAALQRAGFLATRQGNAKARVHLASFSQWYAERYLPDVLTAILRYPEASANDYYFEYVSLNIFHSVQEYGRMVGSIKTILDAHGIDKPIWVMEANFLDPPFGNEVQAAWLVQAATTSFTAGAQGFMIFQWTVDKENPYPVVFGIEDKPASDALRVVGKYFSGPYREATLEISGTIWHVTIDQFTGRVHVLWNFAGIPAPFPLEIVSGAYAVQVMNKYGKDLQLTPEGNTLILSLAPSRAFVPGSGYWVGGDPVIVREKFEEEYRAPLFDQ